MSIEQSDQEHCGAGRCERSQARAVFPGRFARLLPHVAVDFGPVPVSLTRCGENFSCGRFCRFSPRYYPQKETPCWAKGNTFFMGKMSNHFSGRAINRVFPIPNQTLPRVLEKVDPEPGLRPAAGAAAIELRLSNHMPERGWARRRRRRDRPPSRSAGERKTACLRAFPARRRGRRQSFRAPAGGWPGRPQACGADRAVWAVKRPNGCSPPVTSGVVTPYLSGAAAGKCASH